MIIRTLVDGFKNKVYKSRGGIYVPLFDALVPRRRNVFAVLFKGGEGLGLCIPGSNIVTDAGDIYYAQRGAAASPTNAFGIHELFTGRESSSTVAKTDNRGNYDSLAISGTQKAHTATYPKVNDADADNTGTKGVDVVTYLATYAKADFNATDITHGVITNVAAGASEPLLCAYQFGAAFDKTADDTLKVFVNHEQRGV